MIDTHCHLLPGIDDGPRTLEAAVELAIELLDQGVEKAVCTPHWSRAFPTRHDAATAACDSLRAELGRRGMALELVVAAELSDGMAATQPAEELRIRSIGGRWLVVEQVYDSLPNLAEAIVKLLEPEGLAPIFAHPERSRAIQRDPGVLDGARAGGALLQVVVPSVLGEWGPVVQRVALHLLESGRATLLASDAHSAGRRSCRFAEAKPVVIALLGRELWSDVTLLTPRSLFARA
jgi:protein-tyrosine phosphatase